MTARPPEGQPVETGPPAPQEEMIRQIGEKEQRRMKARRRGERSTWFGLGMFGIVGWSVAVPTLLGILLGLWLDAASKDAFSWTVALMLAGVVVGCLNAWYWVSKECDTIQREREEDEDAIDADHS
jgi:ATP synthase protein I